MGEDLTGSIGYLMNGHPPVVHDMCSQFKNVRSWTGQSAVSMSCSTDKTYFTSQEQRKDLIEVLKKKRSVWKADKKICQVTCCLPLECVKATNHSHECPVFLCNTPHQSGEGVLMIKLCNQEAVFSSVSHSAGFLKVSSCRWQSIC